MLKQQIKQQFFVYLRTRLTCVRANKENDIEYEDTI